MPPNPLGACCVLLLLFVWPLTFAGHASALGSLMHLLRSPSRALRQQGEAFLRQHYHMKPERVQVGGARCAGVAARHPVRHPVLVFFPVTVTTR